VFSTVSFLFFAVILAKNIKMKRIVAVIVCLISGLVTQAQITPVISDNGDYGPGLRTIEPINNDTILVKVTIDSKDLKCCANSSLKITEKLAPGAKIISTSNDNITVKDNEILFTMKKSDAPKLETIQISYVMVARDIHYLEFDGELDIINSSNGHLAIPLGGDYFVEFVNDKQ
jgi:hypothetical protein